VTISSADLRKLCHDRPDVLAQLPAAAPRANKYRAKRTLYNGRVYHSKLEAKRARELDLMLRAGLLISWEPQPAVLLDVLPYKPDFRVISAGGTIYEDTKGRPDGRWPIIVRLWREHGPAPLHVLRRAKGGGWDVEVIPRGAACQTR
jgi:hypothetical protein